MRQALRLAAARARAHPPQSDRRLRHRARRARAGDRLAQAAPAAITREVGGAAQARRGGRRGATVYVTLEPRGLHGRTPPCTDRLIAAKVARVVVGMTRSESARRRRRASRSSSAPASTVEVRRARGRVPRRSTGRTSSGRAEKRPWVTLKAAVTLDGRLAARGGDSRWVSGEQSRLEAHRMRDVADAILVGANTVRARRSGADDALAVGRARPAARDPRRAADDAARRAGRCRARSSSPPAMPTRRARGAWRARAPRCCACPASAGASSWARCSTRSAGASILSLLVEGGGQVHGAAPRRRARRRGGALHRAQADRRRRRAAARRRRARQDGRRLAPRRGFDAPPRR